MLDFKRKAAAFLAATIMTVGGAASAEEHEVLIFKGAYFPFEITAKLGDVVKFKNNSGQQHIIESDSGAWTSGPIPAGSTVALVVEPGMDPKFGGYYYSRYFTGEIKLSN